MAFLLKKNNVRTTLAEDISLTELEWQVTDGSVFPSSGDFMVTVWDAVTYTRPGNDPNMEIVRCTSRSTNVLTVTRARESTTAVTHTSGDTVDMLITAGTFDEHIDQDIKTTDDVTFNSLALTGSFKVSLVTKTANYTATDTDHTIICGTGNETFTITLPAASGVTNIIYNIKNIGTGTITVDGNASETIDGSTTSVISTQYASITIQCDGSNWHII